MRSVFLLTALTLPLTVLAQTAAPPTQKMLIMPLSAQSSSSSSATAIQMVPSTMMVPASPSSSSSSQAAVMPQMQQIIDNNDDDLPSRQKDEPDAGQVDYLPIPSLPLVPSTSSQSAKARADAQALPNIVLAPAVNILSPNGGESFPLNAQDLLVKFDHEAFDLKKNDQYEFRAELWKDATRLGYIGGNNPFTLNLSAHSTNLNTKAGKYVVPETLQAKVATPGSGYRVKVLVFLDEKEVASDMSDGSFSFTAGTPIAGTPSVTVKSPNGGESITQSPQANAFVTFTHANLEPYKNGHYNFQVELLKGSTRIGYLGNPNVNFMLNLGETNHTFSFVSGKHIDPATLESVLTPAGNDYTVRIIVFEDDTEILSDVSDAPFSIVDDGMAPASGQPKISITFPTHGSVMPPGSQQYIIFNQEDFDPYKNGQYHFMPELWRNGAKLGYLGNPNMTLALNLNKETTVYSWRADAYTDASFQKIDVEKGGGYKIRIVVEEGSGEGEHVVVHGDSGEFSIGGGIVKRATSGVSSFVKGIYYWWKGWLE